MPVRDTRGQGFYLFRLRLPEMLAEAVHERAWANRRSINAEVSFLLAEALGIDAGDAGVIDTAPLSGPKLEIQPKKKAAETLGGRTFRARGQFAPKSLDRDPDADVDGPDERAAPSSGGISDEDRARLVKELLSSPSFTEALAQGLGDVIGRIGAPGEAQDAKPKVSRLARAPVKKKSAPRR